MGKRRIRGAMENGLRDGCSTSIRRLPLSNSEEQDAIKACISVISEKPSNRQAETLGCLVDAESPEARLKCFLDQEPLKDSKDFKTALPIHRDTTVHTPIELCGGGSDLFDRWCQQKVETLYRPSRQLSRSPFPDTPNPLRRPHDLVRPHIMHGSSSQTDDTLIYWVLDYYSQYGTPPSYEMVESECPYLLRDEEEGFTVYNGAAPTPKIQSNDHGSRSVGITVNSLQLGHLEIPLSILLEMRHIIDNPEYKTYFATETPPWQFPLDLSPQEQQVLFQASKPLKLPREKGFLILFKDRNGEIRTSDTVMGEAIYTDMFDCVLKADRLGWRILAVFHTHPHPTHSLIPGAGDIHAIQEVCNIVSYEVDTLIVGGTIDGTPIINIFIKKPQYSWADFISSPLSLLYDELFPPVTARFFIEIKDGNKSKTGSPEIETFNFYDEQEKVVWDTAKKILLTYHFDILSLDLRDWSIIHDLEYPCIEVYSLLYRLMIRHLQKFPSKDRFQFAQAIDSFAPSKKPKELLTFFREPFLQFYDSHYKLAIPMRTPQPKRYSQELFSEDPHVPLRYRIKNYFRRLREKHANKKLKEETKEDRGRPLL
ncbi:MAG: hypothetical protein EU536_00720 [Promethearchaeota archaeon]|nr:MAG: hypothetical protein EU536_00720 [Candidatus Lokiarchaeota archaeon]